VQQEQQCRRRQHESSRFTAQALADAALCMRIGNSSAV